MHIIDPEDPIYKNLTKRELQNLRLFTREEKEAISMQLFGETLYVRPDWKQLSVARWQALLGETSNSGNPYRVAHDDLLKSARSNARTQGAQAPGRLAPRPQTVSAFSDWMLRLYSPSKDSSALLQGVTGERIVVDYRRRLAYAKRVIPRWEHSSWKLIHDGIRGNFEAAFEIPTLTINGLSLVGVPDLVFREKKTGRILIVELKVSTAELPSDGWPNLRAQLWAYSRIERWAYQAPEVLLAGEVWQHEYTDPVRRATYFWRASNERLNHECKELFQVYGGVVAE